MKKRKLKQVELRTTELLVDWMSRLVSEEEAKKINISNVLSYIPADQRYMNTDNGSRLTAYSPKWIYKQLKTMLKRNPKLDLNTVSLKTLDDLVEKQRALSSH